MKKIFFILTVQSSFSCQERTNYSWGDINESLGELQNARNELQSIKSEIENEGYDCSELEDVDKRLSKVERILEKHFN